MLLMLEESTVPKEERMTFTDKPESANEAQDHSQSLDDGGFFSDSYFKKAAKKYRVSESLLKAIAKAESNFNGPAAADILPEGLQVARKFAATAVRDRSAPALLS